MLELLSEVMQHLRCVPCFQCKIQWFCYGACLFGLYFLVLMDCSWHRTMRPIKIPHLIYQRATVRIPNMLVQGGSGIFWSVLALCGIFAFIFRSNNTSDSMLLPVHVCIAGGRTGASHLYTAILVGLCYLSFVHLCSGRYPLESFLSEIKRININSTNWWFILDNLLDMPSQKISQANSSLGISTWNRSGWKTAMCAKCSKENEAMAIPGDP